MASDYFSLPTAAINEMVDADWELILDASEVNLRGHRATPILLPEPLGPEIDPSNNDDAVAVPSS